MEMLRTLQLEYCITRDFSSDGVNGGLIATVELPGLQVLQLSDEIPNIISVLQCLQIPNMSSVSLLSVCDSADSVDVGVLYETVRQSNGGYRRTLIQSLCIERGNDAS